LLERVATLSEKSTVEILSWRYDNEKDRLELTANIDGEQKEIVLPLTVLEEMSELVPSFEEEKIINELLKGIKEVIQKRHLVIEELDKALDDLRKGHEEARKELKAKGIDKIEVLQWNGVIKSLAAEKVVIAEKRHLIKLLLADESDLRVRLAKIRAGRR
jgi:hypothetical protein